MFIHNFKKQYKIYYIKISSVSLIRVYILFKMRKLTLYKTFGIKIKIGNEYRIPVIRVWT